MKLNSGTTACTAADVRTGAWGSCTPLVACTAPPSTITNAAGVQVGACTTGGTAVQSCTVAIQTCTAAAVSGTTKTHFWQF